MAGVGPGDLWYLADELLEVCTAALDSIPADAYTEPQPEGYEFGAPDRRFVSPHAPIADCCEFLATHVSSIADQLAKEGASGGGPTAPKVNKPLLIVTLLRCVPTGTGDGANYTPPSTEALNAASRLMLADGWVLWNHLYNRIRADQFLERCKRATFVGMSSIAPEGGCGGWQLAFQPELDGYEEDLGT